MINPRFSKIFYISASGICLSNLSDLTDNLLKQLGEMGKENKISIIY